MSWTQQDELNATKLDLARVPRSQTQFELLAHTIVVHAPTDNRLDEAKGIRLEPREGD